MVPKFPLRWGVLRRSLPALSSLPVLRFHLSLVIGIQKSSFVFIHVDVGRLSPVNVLKMRRSSENQGH